MSQLIPPAVIDIEGDDSQFVRVVGEVKVLLADLAKQATQVRIGAETRSLLRSLVQARTLLSTFAATVSNTILGANAATFNSTFATVEGQLKTFGSQTTNTKLGADAMPFESKMLIVKQQLAAFAKEVRDAKVGAATEPFWNDINTLKAKLAAMSPLDIKVDANIAGALTELAILKSDFASALTGTSMPVRNTGAINSALAGWAGAETGGKGGGGGLAGFLAGLTGGGGRGLFGLPSLGAGGAGLALDLAGVSVTHMAVAGLDLAASATSALAGGLLTALGAGGVVGTGMLTNYMGLGSALQDTRAVEQAQNNYQQAVAVYGKNSAQAQQALNQLNYTISQVPKVARSAVVGAANTIQAFKSLFDVLSGPAEAKGAQILSQVVKGLEPFLSVMAKFASVNMTKIQQGLTPILQFLTSTKFQGGKGGMSIFKELENLFTQRLPTGMAALLYGLQDLLKVVGKTAPASGRFLTSIADGLSMLNAQLNKPGSSANQGISNMVASFNQWILFMKSLFDAVYNLFSHGKDQHTGLAIIQNLTNFLHQFYLFETSAKGKTDITNLFKASKSEILDVLDTIVQIVKGAGLLLGALATGGHQGMAVVLGGIKGAVTGIVDFISGIAKIPGLKQVVGVLGNIGGAALGVGALAGILTKLPLLGKAFTPLVDAIGKVGAKGLSSLAGVLGKLPGLSGVMGKLQSLLGNVGKGSAADIQMTAANTMLTASENMLRASGLGGAGGAEGAAAAGGAEAAGAASAYAGGALLAGIPLLLAALGKSKLTPAAATAFKADMRALSKTEQQAVTTYLGRLTKAQQASLLDEAQQAGPVGGRTLTSSILRGANPFNLLQQLGNQATAPVKKTATQITTSLINAIVSDIKTRKWKKGASLLEEAFGMTASQAAATEKILSTRSASVGRDLVTGMASAILKDKSAGMAASKMGSAAIAELKKATGVHSPSVLTRQIGLDFDLGLIQGLQANLGQLIKQEQAMSERLLADLRSYRPDYRAIGQSYATEIAAGFTAGTPQIVAAVQAGMSAAAGAATAGSAGARNSIVQQLRGGSSW